MHSFEIGSTMKRGIKRILNFIILTVLYESMLTTYLLSFRSTAITCGDDKRRLLDHLFCPEKDIKTELVDFLNSKKWIIRDYKIRLCISSNNPEPSDYM